MGRNGIKRAESARGCSPVDYARVFDDAIRRLHAEGRYRVFIDILRNKGAYPNARCFAGHTGSRPITLCCSNDYLPMGQHPKLTAAMDDATKSVVQGQCVSVSLVIVCAYILK